MPQDIKIYRVFIASPNDLAVERRAFKEVIERLNIGFGDGAGVKFIPLGWEDTLASTGRRAQSVIDRDIDSCDVFILAMWRRWGQEAPDVKPYKSYTEHEFHLALNRFKKTKAPRIFVFFKNVEPGQEADPGDELKKVQAFRRELEASRIVLYRRFADEKAFAEEVDKHLRAFAKGDLPEPDAESHSIVLPIEIREQMERAEREARANAEQAVKEHKSAEAHAARATELELTLARKAADAALEGRIEEARQDFAKVCDGTTNIQVLYLAYEFYDRTGDLSAAEEMLNRWLAISGPDSESASTAAAYGNLGLIYKTRGDLDQAEAMLKKALAINDKLGRLEGMASNYGNLGVIYRTRGNLDQAEAMHKKSLAISEKLGRLEGMASQYGNLGLIYQTRGDLDQAEAMHKKSLAINEKLGRLEGMAAEYGNLGVIYIMRGDLDQAEAMLKKSLSTFEKLGQLEGMASDYGNLGNVYFTRGDLDQAETMFNKVLQIDLKLGRLEGIANAYGNLGLLQEQRGDVKGAREFWTKSRDLFVKIGIAHMVKRVQGGLDGLVDTAQPRKVRASKERKAKDPVRTKPRPTKKRSAKKSK